MAFGNPAEIIGPASDEFMQASLRQSRQAHDRNRKALIDRAAAQGRTERGSGSLQRQVRQLDDTQEQRETEFIVRTQETRKLAGINIAINAIKDFFNISMNEALRLLQIEGFINEQDAFNFTAELQNYQGSQQALGVGGGLLLA